MKQDRRVLLVGGRGWIGRALTAALKETRTPTYVTSSADSIALDASVQQEIRSFAPDTAVFLAGMTPDRGPAMGPDRYKNSLDVITRELEAVASLPGLEHLTYLSSGIVGAGGGFGRNIFKEMYRLAKLNEEHLLMAMEGGPAALVVRVFSLSGPYARDPNPYAFYSLIEQCKAGRVKIEADCLVVRSYTSVVDLAEVVLRSAAIGIKGLKSTGGEPLELADLAARVSEVLNPSAEIIVREHRHGLDEYVGPDSQWRGWCEETGVVPIELSEQIVQTATWLNESAQI